VSECRPNCNVADPVSHTVKVDPTLLGGHPAEGLKAQMPAEVDQAKQREEQEQREAVERLAQEERERVDAAERAKAEEERLRQEAEEDALRQEAEAQRRAEEEAETQRKEAELAERLAQEKRERVAAAERAKAEAHAAAAKSKAEVEAAQQSVDDFLKGRGFKNMLTPRKAFCGASIHPLHLAVEENNAETVRSLLRCGADKTQKNSAKMSPLELAEKCNKKGSHDAIVELLKA